MRRSIFLTVAGAAALTLALGACGSGGGGTATTPTPAETPTVEATPTETPTETATPGADANSITVWVDETRQGPVTEAAKKFEADTGTAVNIVQKNFDDIRADFVSQVPTGHGPDITVCAHDWTGELVKNGVVAPLELGALSADFDPVAIKAFSMDGQLYGLPYAIENIALIRNVDLAPNAPATWDEAITMIHDAGKDLPFLIQQEDPNGDPFHAYPFQTSFGAPVFETNPDGSYKPVLALGGDNGHAFANWLAEQGKAGTLSTDMTYDIAIEKFANGSSPFVIGGPWMIASFPNMNLAIDPIPAPGPNPAQPFVGVQGFCLSAQAPNALLANQFMTDYLATEEAQVALFQAGDRPPALLSAAAKATANDPIAAGFAKVGAGGVPMPSIPEMGQVWQFWGVTEADIISGRAADPVAAWDQMVSDIQGAIGG